MKAKAAGSNRTRVLPKASDTGPIPLSRLVDSNGNTLQDSDLITALGKALDVATINGTDASTIFTENGGLHPAFVRQVHEAAHYEERKNLIPDSNLVHDLQFWAPPDTVHFSIVANANAKGGNAFQWIGLGVGVSRSDIIPSSIITVVPGAHYTLSGVVDLSNGLAGGAGVSRWTIRDPTLVTLYAEADGVLGVSQRVSAQWVCPGGVFSVVVCCEANGQYIVNAAALNLYHPQLEVGDGMTKYQQEGVTFGPKTRGRLTVLGGSGAANYQIAKFPAVGGVQGWGDCLVKFSAVRTAVTSNGGFVLHWHQEPGGGVASLQVLACGRVYTDWTGFRVRLETATQHVFLEFTLTPSSDTAFTIEVEPITGTYPSGGTPVAVSNGGATTGSNLLTSAQAPLQNSSTSGTKQAIFDSQTAVGGGTHLLNDGRILLYGGVFTDANGAVGDQTSIHGWNGLGIGALCTTNPLTSTSAGNINVAACTYRRGASAIDVVFNAVIGVATGLAAGAQRFVYADINPVTGGTKAWLATTSASTACNGNYRVCLGQSAPIPSAGSAGGGASGGTGCVDPDAWIDGARRAKELWWGSPVLCSDGVTRRVRPTWREVLGQVRRLALWLVTGCKAPFASLRLLRPEIIQAPRARILGDNVDWTGSSMTPCDLPDGSRCSAGNMYGKLILSALFGWQRVKEVLLLGMGPVVHIHLGGYSYSAGATALKRAFTHNAYKP